MFWRGDHYSYSLELFQSLGFCVTLLRGPPTTWAFFGVRLKTGNCRAEKFLLWSLDWHSLVQKGMFFGEFGTFFFGGGGGGGVVLLGSKNPV